MIDCFHGEHRWLSNFYPAQVEYEGDVYPTVEHAYQAAKTLDPEERRFVRMARTPGAAKIRGRAVKSRSDWAEIKVGVMETLVRRKFEGDADLRRRLLETGDQELVEGNTWGDRFWGVCGGVGENHLGRILMQVRLERRYPTDLADLLG